MLHKRRCHLNVGGQNARAAGHLLSKQETYIGWGPSKPSSRMDFLVLLLFSLALVPSAGVMISIGSKTHYLKGPVRGGAQVFSCIRQNAFRGHASRPRSLSYTLFCKGWFMLNTPEKYLATVGSWSSPCITFFLPYLLLIVNLFFHNLSCVTGPGTITKANGLLFLRVYKFSEVMFSKNVRSSACDLRKAMRSRHWHVCNWCVRHFDHHCVWVNNYIGAWNAKYFLLYFLMSTASAATMTIVSTVFLVWLVVWLNLCLETYINDLGHFQVIDTIFLIQYLFLTFPRIVFLLGLVLVLSCLPSGHLCFALYLATTNQTTDQWYRGDQAWCQCCSHVTWPPSTEPKSTGIFTPMGFGAILERSFYRQLHIIRERRNKNEKSVTAF